MLFRSDPIIEENAKNIYGRFAGTDEERLCDLQKTLDSNEIKAIFCARGGYGLMRIIDKLNFDQFLINPKWLFGFSDITVLLSPLINSGVQSIHSIMAKNLSMDDPNSDPVEILRELLFGTTPEITNMQISELNRVGVSEGIITGGNLSVMYGLRGTKFDIKPEGKILFIEDLCEEPYHIDRMMQSLRISGILAKISGLMVGRFTDINDDPSFGQSVEEIISSAQHLR